MADPKQQPQQPGGKEIRKGYQPIMAWAPTPSPLLEAPDWCPLRGPLLIHLKPQPRIRPSPPTSNLGGPGHGLRGAPRWAC